METENKKPRGFAAISSERHKEISSQGGKAVHKKGTAHKLTSEKAKIIGQKGGQKIRNEKGADHFAQIGKKGGETTARDKEHMAKIGRKGGKKTSENRAHMSKIGKKGGRNKKIAAEEEAT